MKDEISPSTDCINQLSDALVSIGRVYSELKEAHIRLTLSRPMFWAKGDELLTAKQCSKLFDIGIMEVIHELNLRKQDVVLRVNELDEMAISLSDARMIFGDTSSNLETTNSDISEASIEIVRFLLTQPDMTSERMAFAANLSMVQLDKVLGFLEAERDFVSQLFLATPRPDSTPGV